MGHAVADYPLQTDAMASGKNRNKPIDLTKVPKGQKIINSVWVYWLSAHSLTHSAAIFLISGSYWIAILEFLAHWLIDFLKCDNYTNIHQDQFLHVLCKVIWCCLLVL